MTKKLKTRAWIITHYGIFIYLTLSGLRAASIGKLERLNNLSWNDLRKKGYRVIKIEIKEIR